MVLAIDAGSRSIGALNGWEFDAAGNGIGLHRSRTVGVEGHVATEVVTVLVGEDLPLRLVLFHFWFLDLSGSVERGVFGFL